MVVESVRKRRLWQGLVGVAMILIAIYMVTVVVIAVTSGKEHAWSFWPAIGLITVIAGLLAWCAWRLLRPYGK